MSNAPWGDRTPQDPASRAARKLRMDKAARRRKRPTTVTPPSDAPLRSIYTPEFANWEMSQEWLPEDFHG